MTYIELYPKLIQCSLLEPVSIPPIRPSYPRWYKENAVMITILVIGDTFLKTALL